MPETRPGRDVHGSIVRRREVDAFVRTLALAISAVPLPPRRPCPYQSLSF